jgi:hypothetical protein
MNFMSTVCHKSGFMASLREVLGIITLLAVIAFLTAACELEIPVTWITLDKLSANLLVGGRDGIIATIEPNDATNKVVTWTSSVPDVATVSSTGEVTGVANGTAAITVTTADIGKTAACSVTVSGSAPTPATLAAYLVTLSPNSAASPHNITLKVSTAAEFTIIRTVFNGAPNKYVKLDLSGSTVTAVPDWVFNTGEPPYEGCATLAGITMPGGGTSIGNNAFNFCRVLDSVTFLGTIPSSGFSGNAFDGDLYAVFYETDADNGTPGTYTRASDDTWTLN